MIAKTVAIKRQANATATGPVNTVWTRCTILAPGENY